jgi:hypothetical protein
LKPTTSASIGEPPKGDDPAGTAERQFEAGSLHDQAVDARQVAAGQQRLIWLVASPATFEKVAPASDWRCSSAVIMRLTASALSHSWLMPMASMTRRQRVSRSRRLRWRRVRPGSRRRQRAVFDDSPVVVRELLAEMRCAPAAASSGARRAGVAVMRVQGGDRFPDHRQEQLRLQAQALAQHLAGDFDGQWPATDRRPPDRCAEAC